MKFYAEVVLN